MKPRPFRQRLLIATFFAISIPVVLMALCCGCSGLTDVRPDLPHEVFGTVQHPNNGHPTQPAPSTILYHAAPPKTYRHDDDFSLPAQ